jgi:hypothetical protein
VRSAAATMKQITATAMYIVRTSSIIHDPERDKHPPRALVRRPRR